MARLGRGRTYGAVLLLGLAVMVGGLVADALVYRDSGPRVAGPFDAGPRGADRAQGATQSAVPSILPLLASARIADGRVAFTTACGICHSPAEGGGTVVGPDLWNIVGAPVARVGGYPYSTALKSLGGRWTYGRLNRWLLDPQSVAPGTLMSYPGMPDLRDRAQMVAFLRTLADIPVPLPTAAEIAAATQPLKQP